MLAALLKGASKGRSRDEEIKVRDELLTVEHARISSGFIPLSLSTPPSVAENRDRGKTIVLGRVVDGKLKINEQTAFARGPFPVTKDLDVAAEFLNRGEGIGIDLRSEGEGDRDPMVGDEFTGSQGELEIDFYAPLPEEDPGQEHAKPEELVPQCDLS